MELATRCASAEEFIERFARFTTETDVVVPALPHVRVGTAGQFVIRLKDRTVMMQGRCEVTEIRPVGAAPGPARALMRLHLREMDAHSAGVHLRLMERHAAVSRPQPPSPPPAPVVAPAPPRHQTRPLSLVPPLRVVPPPPVDLRVDRPVAPGITAPLAPPPPSPAAAAVPVPVLAAHGSAAVVAVARPSETEPTEIEPLPRPETRAPGAAFTLPANPLSDLDAADLASFVELTLLETAGVLGAAPSASAAAVAPTVRADAHAATMMAPAPAAPADARLIRARRIARRVAPYAACVLVGLVVGLALRPGSKAAPVVAVPSVAPASAVEPPPTPAPADDPAPPKAATRDCVARVTTTPAGATVLWGDVTLGPTPIEHAAIPCGSAVVTFRRERYAAATRTIATERGQTAEVTERLYRPPARLVVTSSPPSALITVNRHRFGQAPRKINTLRYEHLRLEASLPGYRPWKKTVYLKEAEAKVDVTLVPIARPIPRRAAATAATGSKPARH